MPKAVRPAIFPKHKHHVPWSTAGPQSIEQIQFALIIIHNREPAASSSPPNTHTTNVPLRDDVA